MENQLNEWRVQLEQYLLQEIEKIENVDQRLKEAMSYACQSGGKRLRPLFVMTISQWANTPLSSVLPAATALEMIHTYSLIHDDLPGMDNDDYRRGKLTVHKAFDEATAILAGDALLTEAFMQVTLAAISTEHRVKAIQLLAKAAGASGMISGQMRDIASEHQTITLTELQQIHRDKTGQLLQCAVELGLLFLEVSEEVALAFRNYAAHYGLAFQIQNDLQDVCWDAEKTGKQTGKDQALAKNTYVSLLGVEGAKAALNSEIQQARLSMDSLVPQTNEQVIVKQILEYLLTFLEI